MLWLFTALALVSPVEDPVEASLKLAGLTPETARFDKNVLRFFGFDEFVLGSFEAYWEAPWRIPAFEASLRASLEAGAAKPSEIVMAGGRTIGLGTRRTLLGNPNASIEARAKEEGTFAEALAALGAPDAPEPEGAPKAVREAATLILLAGKPVLDAREVSFRNDVEAAWKQLTGTGGEDAGSVDAMLRLTRDTDLRYLISAATDLVLACETANQWLREGAGGDFSYEYETPRGWVALNGGADNRYDARPYLLIIDTGGKDTYIGAAANASAANGVSVVIDLGGDDVYASDEREIGTPAAQREDRKTAGQVPGPGGALCGVSVLFDGGGDDLYRSLTPSQGSANYGVAVLWDAAGNDRYDCYRPSQGFGDRGIGVLLDGAGADHYDCFTFSQGCALTYGFGALVDVTGDDTYAANDTVIDFPSPQSAEHNVSMAQGAGYGRRADYSDGHSLGGGFGVLLDMAGNDKYSCGVFGQGVGYWKSVGLLLDKAGNDMYNGVWYVQGAAAHFAIGIQHDYAGNDAYNATMNMAQGAGHDFSIGLLTDDEGNDAHNAPNLSLGGGNANGIGVFIDRAGDDAYRSQGTTLGKANASTGGVRDMALCLGVFLDLGGKDTYPEGLDWAKNAFETVNWTSQRERPAESQLGVFVDKE